MQDEMKDSLIRIKKSMGAKYKKEDRNESRRLVAEIGSTTTVVNAFKRP